ncbi:hypothetical protein SHELI_v1c08440 [Spiroplasma helicoides]|uniref:Acyltransferase 3 domain-containing protein n=1 Tax=Spiroplasma helicoides TaxID=216938 RepID=A0A1B3SLJ5_9MOLU|nr:acyltransferase family protein [Spiroplasma helicoides]AOG60793.1 hypothetical protein SHELI_v1c08440 [Spiroplasma helicoides]
MKKNSNIEILRICMAVMVMLFHQVAGIYPFPSILYLKILSPWITSSTLVFMLITGYLKSESKNYNNAYFLFLVLFCWIINFVMGCVVYSFIKGYIPFYHMILGGPDWWYIWAFLLVQLFAPILNKILHSFNKYYLSAGLIILYFLLEYTNKWFYGQIFGICNILVMIFMYIIGGIIRIHMTNNCSRRQVMAITWLLIQWIIWVWFGFYTTKEFIYDEFGILSASFATTLFVIIIALKPRHNKVANYLGSCALFVYLFHYTFIEIEQKYIFSLVDNYELQTRVLILAAITILCGITFGLIISKPVIYLSQKCANSRLIQKIPKMKIFND